VGEIEKELQWMSDGKEYIFNVRIKYDYIRGESIWEIRNCYWSALESRKISSRLYNDNEQSAKRVPIKYNIYL